MAKVKSWDILKKLAVKIVQKKNLGQEYSDRLDFEIKEIEKQGANRYWVDLFNLNTKLDHNKNGLVLPYLLGITAVDPIMCDIKHNVEYHPDFPDIDIDLLPEAREHIKKYARDKYGEDYVCNVGMWIRYKTRLALQDAATALGLPRSEVIALCSKLPDEFDAMPFEQACEEFSNFKIFAEDNPDLVRLAYGMSGKIKAQSRHAGGLIIANVPLKDHIPLTYSGKGDNKQWTSAWTEGMADSQLSKFGLVKFDLLGLINISYITNCQKLVKENKNTIIDFNDLDPEDDRAGWITFPNGIKKKIRLNDPKTLKAGNDLKLNSIFQFDTSFQQSIVEKGGIKSFMDFVIYTSLGRPGPLPMIDVYIANRDDPNKSSREGLHPILAKVLSDTESIIVFQEQLLSIWTELCGFTMPEAELAQKAVKKKKTETLLKDIGPKVLEGASPLIGEEKAQELWDTMVSFGQYCFNKSHAVAYCIISYRCLWLKTYFPSEWWASVLSKSPDVKFTKFIDTARSEGIEFSHLDVNNLTMDFTVQGDKVVPGLARIKGIGDSTAESLEEECKKGKFHSFDNFVTRCGSSKIICERLIKLGGFNKIHSNKKALWMWYLFIYGSGKDITKLRNEISYCYIWPKDDINKERKRQSSEYLKLNPKKKAVPNRVTNWLPSTPISEPRPFKADVEISKDELALCKRIRKLLSFEQVTNLFTEDFSLRDKLSFEKEYFGFYWTSPLDMFKHRKDTSVEFAKTNGLLECVIQEKIVKQGANGEYLCLIVTDGQTSARINVWGDDVCTNDPEVFDEGTGIQAEVVWKDQFNSFNVRPRSLVIPLPFVEDEEEDSYKEELEEFLEVL